MYKKGFEILVQSLGLRLIDMEKKFTRSHLTILQNKEMPDYSEICRKICLGNNLFHRR